MSILVQQMAKLSSGQDVLKYLGVTHQAAELNGYEEYILQQFYQHMQHEQQVDVSSETEMFRKLRQLLMKSHND